MSNSWIHENVLQAQAFVTAESYNLEQIRGALSSETRIGQTKSIGEERDAFCIGEWCLSAPKDKAQRPWRAFVFRDGAAVFWNASIRQEEAVMDVVRRFESGPYDPASIAAEQDSIPYECDGLKTAYEDGKIILQKSDSPPDNEQQLMDMFTFSLGLSRSVKLAMLERRLEICNQSLRMPIERLRRGAKVDMTMSVILYICGEILSLRHSVRGINELPDFFWDRERLEGLYVKLARDLNIYRRIEHLNEHLNYCNCMEFLMLVKSHVTDKKSHFST